MSIKGKLVRALARFDKEAAKKAAFSVLGLDSSAIDGGPGSGNFGHQGRPGKVGGSGKGGGKAFRTTTEKGEYVSVAKAKAFKSMLPAERRSKDTRSFLKSLTKDQKSAITEQFVQCKTPETIIQYTERLRQVMAAQKPAKSPKYAMVHGNDISQDYSWSGEAYTDERTGQVIDTAIEDVIHKQGFDGPPKVVSQEEFDKIATEHPEMPVLLRAYAAPSSEALQDYDDMLESGAWYVDCGTGGAQYGQGMYCAGVYGTPADELFRQDDRLLRYVETGVAIGRDGKYYRFHDDHLENGMEDDVPYLFYRNDGTKTVLLKQIETEPSPNGLPRWIIVDVNTGEEYHGDPVEDFNEAKRFEPLTDEEVAALNKKDLEPAKSEMEHYCQLNIKRCRESFVPELADGEDSAIIDGKACVYSKDELKTIDDKKPPEAATVMAKIQTFAGPMFMKGVFMDTGVLAEIETGEYEFMPDNGGFVEQERVLGWAPIKREVEPPEPAAAVRVMTLDPSAKIITYDEAEELYRKTKRSTVETDVSRDDYIDEVAAAYPKDELDERVTIDDIREAAGRYYDRMVTATSRGDSRTRHMFAAAYAGSAFEPSIGKTVTNSMRAAQEFFNNAQKFGKWRDVAPKETFKDVGVLCAALGYDAINAKGHGNSGSYTVVLNRTKVILSDQRVDVA